MMFLKIHIMAMFQESRIRQLLKIELWSFLIFIIFAFLFYQYKDAHIYYYKEDFFSNYDGLVALTASFLSICFFWIGLLFPFLWLIQLIILLREKCFKKLWKLLFLIAILYVVSLFAEFSLLSIKKHQGTLERRSQNNISEVKNKVSSEHWVVLQDITDDEEDEKKDNYIKVEKTCKQKKTFKELPLSFIGYSYNEISDITFEVRGLNPITSKLHVPEKITDSIRLRRDAMIYQEISLKDTVILIFPNKERYILSDFKYKIRPHFTMLSKDWGCDFYEMKINNKVEEGGTATFIKKGFSK